MSSSEFGLVVQAEAGVDKVLADSDDVAVMLAVDVDELSALDAASLAQACEDANAVVLSYLGRDDLSTVPERGVGVCAFIARKVAARIYKNPQDLGSYSFNEVSQSYTDPRVLTTDERVAIRPYKRVRRWAVLLGAEPPAPA